MRRRCRTESRINILDSCILKLRTRNERLQKLGNSESDAFGVKEEKQSIFLDWTSERASPLVSNIERARIACSFIKPVVGIEHATIPVILGVTMELIAP